MCSSCSSTSRAARARSISEAEPARTAATDICVPSRAPHGLHLGFPATLAAGWVTNGSVRVRVDRDRCTGHGRCYALAPEVYEPDDEGFCVIAQQDVDVAKQYEDVARRGALNCPEDAIEVLEDQEGA